MTTTLSCTLATIITPILICHSYYTIYFNVKLFNCLLLTFSANEDEVQGSFDAVTGGTFGAGFADEDSSTMLDGVVMNDLSGSFFSNDDDTAGQLSNDTNLGLNFLTQDDEDSSSLFTNITNQLDVGLSEDQFGLATDLGIEGGASSMDDDSSFLSAIYLGLGVKLMLIDENEDRDRGFLFFR